MLRRILLASAGAMALSGAALAADLPSRAPPPVYLPPPPVFTWTGLYIGGQIGYKFGKDTGRIDEFDATTGTLDSTVPFSSSPSGVIGGGHIGYNSQIAQWVLGLEGDVDGTSFKSGTFAVDAGPTEPTGVPGTAISIRSTIEGSIRGRVGLAWDRFLIYGTGGVAFADFKTNYLADSESPGLFDSRTTTRTGWTVGGGIEYAFTPNWLFGVEYRYSDFVRFTATNLFGDPDPTEPTNAHHHLTQNRVQARVSYKFDLWGPVVAKY
jgi:outer membrane immunogenic protein